MEGWEHIVSAPPCDERIGAPRNGRVCSGRTGRGLARIRPLNESVVKSVSVPESRLKKKHLSICYHSVREAVAGGIIAVKWVKSEDNLADICTKIMSGVTFKRLLSWILIARRLRQVRKDWFYGYVFRLKRSSSYISQRWPTMLQIMHVRITGEHRLSIKMSLHRVAIIYPVLRNQISAASDLIRLLHH